VPPFFRWALREMGSAPSTGAAKDTPLTDGNSMLPAPEPLPDSANVIGGGARGEFQIYSVTRLPSFDSATWQFAIDGLVDRPATWNWEQFLKLSRTVQVSDFHCVTGWSVYHNTWEGIRLSKLLEQAGVQSKANFVKFYSGDGVYTDTLSLEQANMEDVLVAVLHDGKPIHRDYGGPVRLIVPRMYAYKSVKWLNRIELIEKDQIGFWEQRGYDTDAWVRA
jgi:methionine sulfoxide reductase catalytic subunit